MPPRNSLASVTCESVTLRCPENQSPRIRPAGYDNTNGWRGSIARGNSLDPVPGDTDGLDPPCNLCWKTQREFALGLAELADGPAIPTKGFDRDPGWAVWHELIRISDDISKNAAAARPARARHGRQPIDQACAGGCRSIVQSADNRVDLYAIVGLRTKSRSDEHDARLVVNALCHNADFG